MTERTLPEPEDDSDRGILSNIEEYGWSVIAIEEDEEGPALAFSLGIYHTLNHPEIVIMGLPPQVAQSLINDMGEAIRAGQRFHDGERHEGIVEQFPVTFVQVARRYYRPYLGYARWLYRGSNFPVLQCVWPDKQGLFPWEPGYDARFFALQRLLGPAGALEHGWPFADPPNVMSILSRPIADEGHPILLVVHAEDGTYQFLTGAPVRQQDLMLVALREVVRRDPSITTLADLPLGGQARREAVDQPWQQQPVEGSDDS